MPASSTAPSSQARPVVLIGLPGVGKTTIGKHLANRLGQSFRDMDRLLEVRFGCSIRLLFERDGEARFREFESELLGELLTSGEGGCVIASGGGCVELAANRALIAERATAVYIRAEPHQLWPRLQRDTKRPLLQVAEPLARLESLHAQRAPHYEGLAVISVDAFGVSLARLVDDVQLQLYELGRSGSASSATSSGVSALPPSIDAA